MWADGTGTYADAHTVQKEGMEIDEKSAVCRSFIYYI